MTELIRYPFTDHGVRDALRALGTTANAVARNLDAMGFKGCLERSMNCPIARYVLASIDGADKVSVSFGTVAAWNSASGKAEVPMTDPVSDFVELFDLGRFPQLETPEEESRG